MSNTDGLLINNNNIYGLVNPPPPPTSGDKAKGYQDISSAAVRWDSFVDLSSAVVDLSNTQLTSIIKIHNNAERFDPKIEEMFKYLQIFTAACDSFSHGANDVANAIGPFAAIYLIYRENGNISKKVNMGNDAYWILGMGGIGIAIGFIS